MDIDFPNGWLDATDGPAFGVEGLRKKLAEPSLPLLISPVKPCVGLSPEEFAERSYHCLKGGFHGVKDDELILDPPYSAFRKRVSLTAQSAEKAANETHEPKLYFAHIGGDAEKIGEYYDIAIDEGASGIMVSPWINGIDCIKKFKGRLPIISHNNLTYAMARHPWHGISFSLQAKIQRMCGADIIVCPAPFGSFDIMSKEEHVQNVDACLNEELGLKKMLPGFSGAQTPMTTVALYQSLGTMDFGVLAGGAVYNHPMGIEAGAMAFRQALESMEKKIDVAEYAKNHRELKAAIDTFHKKNWIYGLNNFNGKMV